ncbi:MAG: FMN-binding negative transcriptional regulator [Pseudomonadota bacterium]
MYIPPPFEESRLEVLHTLIKAHPLATLVTQGGGELAVNHVPFFLDEQAGEFGTLRGHVARANPVWKNLGGSAIAVFQGPTAYISPSWYPSKKVHGKVVPTWNYVVTHAHGEPRAIEDADWLMRQINALTDENESNYYLQWKVSDAPDKYIEQMRKMIVGIEIPIKSLVGKWKLSQNKSAEDKQGVISGLKAAETSVMAELIEQHK